MCHKRTLMRAALERGRLPVHTLIMAAPGASAPPYQVKVRRCTIHVGRFRWDILVNGKPAESSPDSYVSREEAKADGLARLKELVTAPETGGSEKPASG